MAFNATCNNISVISWWCFIDGGNKKKPPTCRKSLTNITYDNQIKVKFDFDNEVFTVLELCPFKMFLLFDYL
jgi:hypothetical protein